MSSPPTKYLRYFDFTTYAATYPDKPLPGASVDVELNRLKLTTDQTIDRLALIQRDDGTLRLDGATLPPGSIGTSQLLDGSVTTPKLADGAVTPPKMAPDFAFLTKTSVPQLGIGQMPRTNAAVDASGNFPGIPYGFIVSNRNSSASSSTSLILSNDQNKTFQIQLFSSGSGANAGETLIYSDAGAIDFVTNSGANSPFTFQIGGTKQLSILPGVVELTGSLRTTQIGIGGGPRSNYAVDANGNLPVPFVISVVNASSASGAAASFQALNNVNKGLQMMLWGPGNGGNANLAFFYTDAGGMSFQTNSGANSPFQWLIGGAIQATMTLDLLTLEKDLRIKRNLIVDGSYNPASISTGVLQATQIGINQAPRSNAGIDASGNFAGIPYGFIVSNRSAANLSATSLVLQNDQNKGLQLLLFSSGSGANAGQALFYNDAGSMDFQTNSGAASPFTWRIGNTLQATMSMGLLALTGGLSVAGAAVFSGGATFPGGITLPANAVPAAAIADGAVTLAKHAPNSVDSSKIVDGSIDPVDLSPATLSLITSAGNPRGAWVTATAYAAKDSVTNGGGVYVCAVAHTSGVFATDLGAGKWFQTGQIVPVSTQTILKTVGGGTYNTPAGCRQLRIRMLAGGGGGLGAAVNTASSGSASPGTASNFGTVFAAPGQGGVLYATRAGGSNGAGVANLRIAGGQGSGGGTWAGANPTQTQGVGQIGGNSVFGGAGGGSVASDGGHAAANSGAGGGGGMYCDTGGGGNHMTWGGSGSASEYVELIITAPAASYAYVVGGGGAGDVSAVMHGGNGGSGIIIIDEIY